MRTFRIGDSNIHGKGVIAAVPLKNGQIVGKGICYELWGGLIPIPYVTQDLGKWINHANKPNTTLKWADGCWYIVTNRAVTPSTELTLNYNHTPWYIQGPESHFK